MAYKWTDQDTIQNYLASAGNIAIGANEEIKPAAAELFENDAVFEITTILSTAWEGIDADDFDPPDDLKRMAAKLAASRLGVLRVSGAIGQTPKWVETFRSEVIAQVMRMVINFQTTVIEGATRRTDVTFDELLIKVKQREFVPQPPA